MHGEDLSYSTKNLRLFRLWRKYAGRGLLLDSLVIATEAHGIDQLLLRRDLTIIKVSEKCQKAQSRQSFYAHST